MYEASGMELLFEINGNFAVEIHIEDGITCKLHHNGDEVCMTVHDLDEVQDTESARHSMKTLLLPFASRTGNVFERTEPIALSLN